jgi:hypothetical protein
MRAQFNASDADWPTANKDAATVRAKEAKSAEVRCRHMKLLLRVIDALDEPARGRIRAALPEDDLRLIEETTSVAWLPVEIDLRATEVIWRALDPLARVAFFRRLGDHDFESSLLKSIVTSAIRIFGVEPGRLLHWMPRGWAQLFRDSTRITINTDVAKEARVTFDDLPPQLAESPAWRDSVAASMTAFYGATRREGTVRVESADPLARSMVLLFRWV